MSSLLLPTPCLLGTHQQERRAALSRLRRPTRPGDAMSAPARQGFAASPPLRALDWPARAMADRGRDGRLRRERA